MSENLDRNAFIGKYGPADWLTLKEEILDSKAVELEQILPLIEERARSHSRELEVLDVASGVGHFTVELHRAAHSNKVIGLDDYREYMDIARTRYHEIPLNCLEANLYKTPFADGTFDIVATRSTLDIMNGPMMFKEMVRVLKPGGWIYISLVYNSTYKFAPGPDHELEMKIRRAYDVCAIEWGRSHGVEAKNGSRGGRFLPRYAWDHGLKILKLVSADWFLYPNPEFTSKEKAVMFLQLDMLYQACKRVKDPEYALDPIALDRWYERVQSEIANNRTTYGSHQYSMLAEKPVQ
jgi:SAM-dependent methyltransferase